MKSFKAFLLEEIIPMYHRTNPTVASRLQGGEKIRAGGLSFFMDPKMAAEFEGERSLGTVHPGAPTVTGKTPSSNVVPDVEWHPDAYTKMFKDLESKMKNDPSFRPPSLQTTSHDPSTGKLKWQQVIPGAVAVEDPTTGKKRIQPGWKPGFKTDSAGRVVPTIEPHPENKTSMTNLQTQQTTRSPTFSRDWGGSASVESLSGFPEQQQLHAISRRSDLRQMVNSFISSEINSPTGLKGFRTIAPGNTKIDNPNTLPTAKSVAGKAVKGLGVVGAIADPAGTAFQTAADAAGGRLAGAVGGGLGAALFINQSAGDPVGDAWASWTPEMQKAYTDQSIAKYKAQEEERKRQQQTDRDNYIIRNPQMGGPVNKPKY